MGLFGTAECNVTNPYVSVPICCEGGSGTLLGCGGMNFGINFPSVDKVTDNAVAVLYLIILLWLFMGVGKAADCFMCAIEQITSTTHNRTQVDANGHARVFRVRTWNPTVANLTLMALGSSAPEILLSLIELLFNDYYSGELGPSTIVGSAAFNLLIIVAICVPAISADDSRKIVMPYVYAITATASVFAYIWLIVILVFVTPDVITIAEALITLLCFPVLVLFAYYADKWADVSWRTKHPLFKRCAGKPQEEEIQISPLLLDVRNPDGSPLTPAELMLMVKRLQRNSAENSMSEEQAVATISKQLTMQQPKSRAYYRVAANRGSVKTLEKTSTKSRSSFFGSKKIAPIDLGPPPTPTVEFAAPAYAVIEAAGSVTVMVTRSGPLEAAMSVEYTTEDGEGEHAAKAATKDYVAKQGQLEFAAGVASAQLTIEVLDDDEVEPDEHFFIKLLGVSKGAAEIIGEQQRTKVTIINDDFPGTLVFPNEDIRITEGIGELSVAVARVQGCSGAVSCKYRSIDGTAIAGMNYTAVEGTLEWAHQDVAVKHITIPITDDDVIQGKQTFDVEITSATGGAVFDAATDGSTTRSLANVTIEDDEKARTIGDRAIAMMGLSQQTFSLGTTSWKEQFANALKVKEDEEDADGEPSKPTPFETALHVLTLPFKLLCACVPPTTLGAGWPCFICALVLIGFITALIGDTANLLGCALGLKNSVVAISLVALGTSLPDTFASMQAAQNDVSADAAIGNVTGSNAVNVFLGVGLAWMLGSIYWTARGVDAETIGRYQESGISAKLNLKVGDSIGLIVPAGDLGLSVIVFVGCALICFATLTARRFAFGYELGGKLRMPTAALLVSLWVLYIALSTVQAYAPFYVP